MAGRVLILCIATATLLSAQSVCPPAPTYTPCDIVLELSSADLAAHPNPFLTVDLSAEIRSPSYRTIKMPAFFAGGNRMVIRFAPTEPGQWVFRVSGNIAAYQGKQGTVTATPSDLPGFIRPINTHHWYFPDKLRPHLWMGDTCYRFGLLDRHAFDQLVATRAAQRFNHLRGLLIGSREDTPKSFPSADQPNYEYFHEMDARVLALNRAGIIVDLILGGDEDHLLKLFPTWQQRERYLRYVVARYSAMNVTWQLVQEFEEYTDARALMKELGTLLKRLDPYNHPRTTHTVSTSAPLLADGWMDYVLYQSSDIPLGAIEHQLYPVPFVNAEFGYENSGAGQALPHHVDTSEFRRRLWHAVMNGQYPTFGNTGTYMGRFPFDAKYLDSPGARQMGVWHELFSRTRYWDMDPYFDVDGGRCIALPSIEYVVYLEKPGPVEIVVAKEKYDIYWINPITGETIKEKKQWKGDRFTAQPPNLNHDWVLHLSRDGKKESMARSYRFEARTLLMQEVEIAPKQIPYNIAAPDADEISVSQPPPYAARVTRETRATSAMMWLWTAEVSADGLGYRVVGTGAEGTLRIPRNIAKRYPAVLSLRLLGMNLVGKVYSLDRVYRLVE